MYDFFTLDAKALLSGLLERDPTKRISTAAEIKKHPWFRKIDWKQLIDKKIKPPFIPTVTAPDDTRNIDQMFLRETIRETMPMMNMNSFSTKQKNHFGNFTYISNKASNIGATSQDGNKGHSTSHNAINHPGHRMVSKTTAVDEEDENKENDDDHGEMFVEIVAST